MIFSRQAVIHLAHALFKRLNRQDLTDDTSLCDQQFFRLNAHLFRRQFADTVRLVNTVCITAVSILGA